MQLQNHAHATTTIMRTFKTVLHKDILFCKLFDSIAKKHESFKFFLVSGVLCLQENLILAHSMT